VNVDDLFEYPPGQYTETLDKNSRRSRSSLCHIMWNSVRWKRLWMTAEIYGEKRSALKQPGYGLVVDKLRTKRKRKHVPSKTQ